MINQIEYQHSFRDLRHKRKRKRAFREEFIIRFCKKYGLNLHKEGPVTIEITSEMKELINNALSDKYPCIVGTSSSDGLPNVSYKGSVMVFSATELAFWERAQKGGFAQLTDNPNIVVMYRNTELRKSWRFYGKVTIYDSGKIRDHVLEKTVQPELDRDPDRLGVAIVIKVTKITTLGGEIVQEASG